uniref:NACHT, LRR and PYD domains-containing protein 14-like n=1 Tax=Myxine glutinosa TaxID=7769 RepID=UPI00359013C5
MSTWLAKVLSCDQRDNSYLLTLLHCARELWGKDNPEDGDLGSQDPTTADSEDVQMEDDRTLDVKSKTAEERKEKEGTGAMSMDHKEMGEGLKRLDSKQSKGGSEMITRSLAILNFSMLPLNTRDCDTITWVLSSPKLLAKHSLGMQPDGCVTSLSCDYSYLSNEALRALVPIMHRCIELRFCENFLSDDTIPLFVGVLKNPDCSIEQLALKSNSLTDASVPLLCEGISINTSLLWLWLGGNEFSQEGISRLEQAAQGRPEMHLMI